MTGVELAVVLLGMRVVATIVLVAVLIKQIINLRTKQTDYPVVRWGIFAATIILLLGQFIPITLDTAVAFFEGYEGRHRQPNLLSSSYALNNATKDLVIAGMLALMHYWPGRDRR